MKDALMLTELWREMLPQLGSKTAITNYGVPGMTSRLLDQGVLRVLTASTRQQFFVTPHSHRYDLLCLVLEGEVENILYEETGDGTGEEYGVMRCTYEGKKEAFKKEIGSVRKGTFVTYSNIYCEGDCYFMKANEIHTVVFEANTTVLVMEGVTRRNTTQVLLPVGADGKPIDTLQTQPWMYQEVVG